MLVNGTDEGAAAAAGTESKESRLSNVAVSETLPPAPALSDGDDEPLDGAVIFRAGDRHDRIKIKRIRGTDFEDEALPRVPPAERNVRSNLNPRYADSLTGDALELCVDAALETEDMRLRLLSERAATAQREHELRAQLTAQTELTCAAESCAAEASEALRTQERLHAEQLAAVSTEQSHTLAAQAQRHERSRAQWSSALETERTRRKDADARADACEERRVADLRQQDADLRSNNERTRARAHKADELERRLDKVEGKWLRASKALDDQREKRREAEERLIKEQDAAIAAMRARDAEVRSSNARLQESVRAAENAVRELRERLEMARRMEHVEVAERLAAELLTAQDKLGAANKANASLRQRVAQSGVTRAEEQLRAANARIDELESTVAHHAKHLSELDQAEEEAIAKEKEADRRQRKTHTQALRRGRVKAAQTKEARKETARTKEELAQLTSKYTELVAENVSLRRDADERYEALMARLNAGESRNTALLSELASVGEVAASEAKQAALRHKQTLRELAASEAALEAYRNFQAKEGGKYKASVRMCYYKLIDLKVPTNQIEGVVREVLGMVGCKAEALPKRSVAQNMRREMEHWADVVAGVELAKAHHVTGASDDTTKRQRTLAADLVHFVGEEGVRRTLCIGLSCMSRGTAASKAEHFERRVDQVREAAKLSVPTIHGAKEALDRVTLQYLITSWDCDRAITERNAAEQIEERKGAEVRAREGGKALASLRARAEGWEEGRVGMALSVHGLTSMTLEVKIAPEPPSPPHQQRLLELEQRSAESVRGEDGSAIAQMTPDEIENATDAEAARRLGQEWWERLPEGERRRLTVVYAGTCNAHRWVNVAKGCDEGIKRVFNEIKAGTGGNAWGGAPWDRLIWEVAKLCCMNARKMNVALGQDLLGYQMIELGKSAEDCLHTKIKVCACKGGKGVPLAGYHPPAFAVGLLI